ncbi:hypothetical protein ACHAXR_007665 [Thalassiosira sp. AJA248-18]
MVTYNNPGGRIGPKTKTSKRTVTNPDGTRTIITTTEITTTNAFKEETTKKIDTKHLPSLPRIRREKVTLDDGTTGWKKTSTVVHPGGQREITITHPDGTSEVKIEEGPKSTDVVVESIPKEHNKVLPSWPSFPWDSTMKKLGHHAEVMPHKTAIAFLQTNGNNTPTISSSMTYQKLNYAVEYLAARLLPPEDVDDGEAAPKKALVPIPKDQPPLAKGDRILLVYPPCSPHFILGFLACLRAGLVAVPVYPPHPDRKDSVAAFVGIARGCGARVALTNGEYAQAKRLGKMKNAFMSKLKKKKSPSEGGDDSGNNDDVPTWPEELIWVVTDREPLQNPPNIFPRVESTPEPHETAFIQYTSGSTSAPKGVVLTHSNLAHNLYIITDELDAGTETKVVSWLPQYHDMGLIGSLIGVIYSGGSGYYMSPIAFLQRPIGWLEAVSEYRGTHLQAPNFAFGLTARKFHREEYYNGLGGLTVNEDGKQVKPLDLSCVKHAINGAEPVTEKSMGAFVKAFSPFGFAKDVIYPTYGLAEHTVFVCSGGKGKILVHKKELEEENKIVIVDEMIDPTLKSEGGTVSFIGCGFPLNQNVDVRIVDPVRRVALPDETVGEIWVNSPSKALKYYGKDVKETKMDFHALLEDMKASSEKYGGYLRSGDLGFLHKEQLYICGRIKDLIIVGGRNHYPQDIEATAEEVASEHVRPGCSAAFSIGLKSGDTGDYEEVVLAMELKEPLPKANKRENIVNMVRAEIFKEHSLSLSCIVLVKPKTIPKTTSGKIQRSKAQQAFLTKTLQEVYRKEFPTGDVADFGYVEVTEEKQSKPSPKKALTPAEIRALDKPAIRKMLVDSISQLANIDASSIKDGASLTSFMDSVKLAQFKGLLEGQYAVKPMSDAYLFNDSTTVKKLVEVVKVGTAKDDTGEGGSGGARAGGGGGPGCCGCTVM